MRSSESNVEYGNHGGSGRWGGGFARPDTPDNHRYCLGDRSVSGILAFFVSETGPPGPLRYYDTHFTKKSVLPESQQKKLIIIVS